ncbi:hypothetical protein C1645_813666 [Glomus cerebriforme]|uniref:AIG1-type G domain-containing protein n=1 Tax=Glomus cerebriforme TaxID=658196 RepID=A0A397THS4_9GLOM|nr:hypothetical protein C1645_813666 [Glomus cerebriforme]
MNNLSQRCILAVGNTGNGKSFTATVFGAQNVIIGHSSKSQTDTITIHKIKNGGFYIDTPGFDDSDEDKGDDDTVRSIFRKMFKEKIQKLTTILWFVTPDVRAKGSYKRQAKFIESLAEYCNGNVWENTIIVTKGDTIQTGPRDAAREIAKEIRRTQIDVLLKTADFKILLFESLKPESVYVKGNFTSEMLNEFGVFKGSEPDRILAKYESLMKYHLNYPIHLSLKIVKCSKCSEENDRRLASSMCHSGTESFHPETECVHVGNVIDIHPSSHFKKHSSHYVDARTQQVFDHSPQAWTVRVFSVGIVNPTCPEFVHGYWNCCGNGDVNSSGCKEVYRCCEKDLHSSGCQRIYDVCRHKIGEPTCLTICRSCKKRSDTNGCKERCNNCKDDNSRNKAGCIKTSHKFSVN